MRADANDHDILDGSSRRGTDEMPIPSSVSPLLPTSSSSCSSSPDADAAYRYGATRPARRHRTLRSHSISPTRTPSPPNSPLRGARLAQVDTRSSDPLGDGRRLRHGRASSLDRRDTRSDLGIQGRLHHRPRSRRDLRTALHTLQEMAEGTSGTQGATFPLEDQVGTNFGLPVTFGLQEIEERRQNGDFPLRRRSAHPSDADAPRSPSVSSKPLVYDDGSDGSDGDDGDDDDDGGRDDESGDRSSDSESFGHFDPSDPPDNSAYPQVRASVPATDDITLSVNTPRMWVLSMLFAVLGSATNLFFSLRYPSVSLTPVIALLLVHPLGLLWDTALKRVDDPVEVFADGYLLRRSVGDSNAAATSSPISPVSTGSKNVGPRATWRLWLAQGRWNEKEHACVYISSNVSFGFAFATDVIVEQSMFYKQTTTVTYQILLTLSTQILGYTLAGLTRRYLVKPPGMIWPSTLISTSMFATLHTEENQIADGWKISRWRFFLLVFLGSCAWFFFPGLLIPALSYFNFITWFAPRNVVIANLFGTASGLGLFPLTFDWSQVAYTGSPLVTPFWAALNVVGGLVFIMWIAAPLMYYANVLWSSYMPILSAAVFDNTGKPYDVSRILTPDFLFDAEAYATYSRVFLPITYVLSYATQFAALTALITHTACWHGRDILMQGKKSFVSARGEKSRRGKYSQVASDDSSTSLMHERTNDMDWTAPRTEADGMMSAQDVHNRLMRRYQDVPMWWYLTTGAAMLAIGIFVVEYYPVHLPWHGLLLAFGISAALFVPIGIVMAITSTQSSIYLVCQIICGTVFPGRPVANMVFVTYGYITSTQGLKFSSDMKLGQYMKVPPQLLFMVQFAATVISSLTQIGVLNWMLNNVPGICTPQAINGFTCPIARVHFNGSILWGVVGPARFFGPGAIYRPLVWAFIVGAVLPPAIYLVARSRPHQRFWRKVSFPVIFGALSWIPPATGLNFSVWALVCWIFNYVVRNRKEAWWKKYNMTLSAALDAGVAFGVVIVFFVFVYSGLSKNLKWWGTEVYKEGCDWQACPYLTVPDGERFGPDHW